MSLEFETNVVTEGNKIILNVVSNRTILDDKMSIYDKNDEVNVLIVDKLIKEFNRIGNNLIVDYNYEVIDKNTVIIKVLLKHMFSKFGETQKYLVYEISYDNDSQVVTGEKTKKKIDLKIPSSCHRAPFNTITVSNTKTNDKNTTVITVLADQLVSEFANFDMIMSFTKNLIFSNYKNIDNYIKIANEE